MQKEKEREGCHPLTALMEERVLGSMSSDRVCAPPETPPVLLRTG